MSVRSILIIAIGLLLINACQKDEGTEEEFSLFLPETMYDYTSTQDLPENLFFSINNPLGNEVSDAGATLGRVLFYDKRLSITNKTSCASCHKQEHGFADSKARSEGFFLGETRRNSPGLLNMRHQNDYFWDGRVTVLEDQVTMPISDHIEMGFDHMDDLLEKMQELNYYPPLFEAAFGTQEVSEQRISMALGQFIRSMTSYHTKFDEGRQSGFQNFTIEETRGRVLFFEALPCGSCHNGNDLSGWGWANIGLDMEYQDNGIGEVESDPVLAQSGGFMIPSLRNITRTAPYMHDGRFQTLEEVIHHYASGVQPHPFLSFSLRHGGWDTPSGFDDIALPAQGDGFSEPLRFNLSDADVAALVKFLETLNDDALAYDARFSDPFR